MRYQMQRQGISRLYRPGPCGGDGFALPVARPLLPRKRHLREVVWRSGTSMAPERPPAAAGH